MPRVPGHLKNRMMIVFDTTSYKCAGHVAQSLSHLTQEPEVPGRYPVRPFTFVSPSADSRIVVSYWRKYVHLVLVNR